MISVFLLFRCFSINHKRTFETLMKMFFLQIKLLTSYSIHCTFKQKGKKKGTEKLEINLNVKVLPRDGKLWMKAIIILVSEVYVYKKIKETTESPENLTHEWRIKFPFLIKNSSPHLYINLSIFTLIQNLFFVKYLYWLNVETCWRSVDLGRAPLQSLLQRKAACCPRLGKPWAQPAFGTSRGSACL